MEIQIARSATKHRVSRRDIEAAVLSTSHWLEIAVPPESRLGARRWICIGRDRSGKEIEVIVARDGGDGKLVAIHAMKLRNKTRRLFEHE